MTDFPFDVIFGNNGDASICLPAGDTEPEPDNALLEGGPNGVVLTRRSGERLMLDVDPETKTRLLDRASVVIVETDAAENDIRYMYAARIAA
jgi:hypothetical protein